MKRILSILVFAIAMTGCTASGMPIEITVQMTGTNVSYALNAMPLPLQELERRMEKVAPIDEEQMVVILAQPEVPLGRLHDLIERFWMMKMRNVHLLLVREGDNGREIIFKGMEPLRPEDLKGKIY